MECRRIPDPQPESGADDSFPLCARGDHGTVAVVFPFSGDGSTTEAARTAAGPRDEVRVKAG